MTGFAVVNPRAGSGRTGREWPSIERRLRAAYPGLQHRMTSKRGDAALLVRRALEEGHSEIVAVGGDGTINEAVNGFFGAEGSLAPDAVLAFVTTGTGGDFRKTFAIGPGAAAAIARLEKAAIRAIDVGRISCLSRTGAPIVRYFVNIGSFGLSGAIVNAVNRARFAKLFGGRFAFAFHSARAMLFHRERMVRLRIDGDYDEIASVSTVAVANGQYFGGGMRIAPNAVVDDGLFDVVVIAGGRRAAADLKHLYKGTHVNLPGIRTLRGRKIVAAPVAETGGHAVLIETDGESAGILPATFEILPHALNVRC